MGDIKQEIKEKLFLAMKGKNELACLTLRGVLAALVNKEIEKGSKISKKEPKISPAELGKKSQLEEKEIIEVIATEAKKRREAIAGFEKGGRKEMAEKEKMELELLKKYLPEQLSEKELREIIKKAVSETGAKDMKDIGKLMGKLMPEIKGRVDGGVTNRIVKEFLEK